MKAEHLYIPKMHDGKLNFWCEKSSDSLKTGTYCVKSARKNEFKEKRKVNNPIKAHPIYMLLICRIYLYIRNTSMHLECGKSQVM